MAKQGVWGERNKIFTPILYKRVTCATCKYYSREDYSCLVSPIIPKINGYDYWKQCKQFELDDEYNDLQHRQQVTNIKGASFFSAKSSTSIPNAQLVKEKLTAPQTVNQEVIFSSPGIKTISKQFIEKVLVSLKEHHGIEVQQMSLDGLPSLGAGTFYINSGKKLLVVIIPELKTGTKIKHPSEDHKKIDRWSRFQRTLLPFINFLSELPDSSDFEKWIIVPVYPYEKDLSLAETFYYKQGTMLNGIKLIESDKTGQLLFATGPIFDKYWTSEKIHNLKIFDDVK